LGMLAPATAQQDAQFSQYMFNKTLINPAATGSDDVNVSLLYRTQWVSQPGAPKSFGIVADAPVANKKVGLGIILVNTSQGPLAFTRINTNYSYKIDIGNDAGLYLGLQAGIVQYAVNQSMLKTHDDIATDQTFAGNNLRKIIPDFGFGLMYKTEKFHIGLTVPHLLQSKIKFINQVIDTTGISQQRKLFSQVFRHYYATAGVNIDVNEDFQIQPAIITRYVINAPFVADINCNVTYKKMLWGGLGYRISNLGGIVGIVGLTLNNAFKVGYAFDFTTSGLAVNTGASHEIMLSYHLETKADSRGGKGKKKKGGPKKPYFLK
jgi:type IX secretion system PorP/SprF family membrane protein